MKTLHDFYIEATARFNRSLHERYGQAFFNYLHEVRPDLSEQVRATMADPFYIRDLNDPRWKRFVEFIEKNWHSK